MRDKAYLEIVTACEAWLAQYGDNARGVGWLRDDAETRYRTMLEVIRPTIAPVTLLDFGCGLSHLYEYILKHEAGRIKYAGLDISEPFLERAKHKFPEVTYYNVDLLDSGARELPQFDYVILNGIFTYRGSISNEQMFQYLCVLVRRVFAIARVGIAFNMHSKQVEWERDDLFHLPIDLLLTFLSRQVSRHVVIRHDYGLYEYTAYVYREASVQGNAGVKMLVNSTRATNNDSGQTTTNLLPVEPCLSVEDFGEH